jgi:hypothetical protein
LIVVGAVPLIVMKDWHCCDAFRGRYRDLRKRVYEYPLLDRDPVAQGSFRRVALTGNAVHPIDSDDASQANPRRRSP